MPFFSVLIPSYNRPELIGETVKSVFNNNFDDFELIVSDDKSPRQSEIAMILQPFLQDHRFHLHLQPENLREPGNRDFLFHQARGQYLIILGDDDLLYPHALSTLATQINQNPGADIYAFGYTIIDDYGHEKYSRQVPKSLRLSVQNQRLAQEIIVSDYFPFWMYHPATFCANKEVHNKIKSNLEVGIGDDYMFMIDFINEGGVLQIISAVLMYYRKSSSDVLYDQSNQSSGELPHLIARAKILKLLLSRTDFHQAIAGFVKSRKCRERLLYDPILWSSLQIENLPEEIELTDDMRAELNSYRKYWTRILYRKWLSLRRILSFYNLFGIAGLHEMGKVLLNRMKHR